MNKYTHGLLIVCLTFAASLIAQEKQAVFSGPQAGETVAGFKVVGVYDDQAGKTFDPLEKAGDDPLLLIFFHQPSRPAAALVRSRGTP